MGVATVSPAEVHQLIKDGGHPVIVDVRTPAEFAGVHVTGAHSVPLDSLNADNIEGLRQSGGPVYVICQSGGRSAKACERLADAGLAQVFSVEGGTAAWEHLGLPVVRGPGKMISLERQVRIAAGLLVAVGSVLAWFVSPLFLALTLFVGCGLVFAGVTNRCGMAMMLGALPWNQRAGR